MKKIPIIVLMIISAGITVYAVMFWQPSSNIMVANEIDNNIEVASENNMFKVNESEVKKLLTKDEKKRIDDIIKKMSSVDLNNLKSKFNNENKSEGFKEGFSLIRTRTSNKEYEEIKEILSEYIDFNLLELEV